MVTIECSDKWWDKCENILHVGIYAKFSQNELLAEKLLNTGTLQLYEATTDEEYGCGIGLKSSKWVDASWQGRNMQGVVTMRVRNELSEGSNMSTEGPIIVNSENTLHDLATQTITAMEKTPSASINSEPDQQGTLEEWLGDSKARSYEEEFPYLHKAKSPPLNPLVSRGGRQFNQRRAPYKQKKRTQVIDLEQPQLETDDKRPNSAGRGQAITRNSVDRSHPNMNNNRNQRSRNVNQQNTSTPIRSSQTKNHCVNMSKRQKTGMRKMGLEPSSDFVQNIMKNHQFR